jgi:hypothetical protein
VTKQQGTELTTAPGRFVFGDLYDPETEDFDGNQMIIKSGADKGKPTQLFIIGLAIPKTQAHWGNEPGWGQTIWATGHAEFPGDASLTHPWDSGAFSWKIYDGDSTVIPKKSKSKVKPCDREGWKGCWVLRLSSQFAPQIYNALDPNNPVPMPEAGAVRPGYVIQVVGTVKGNTGASPGVYLNHNAVGLRAYLPEIITRGVDVKGKFGGALPAGASALPAASAAIPTAAPPVSAAPVPPPAVPAAAPPASRLPTAVVPAPAVMGIPPVAPIPAPPASSVPTPPPAMAPSHKGHPVSEYLTAGWTMEQLRADGYLG